MNNTIFIKLYAIVIVGATPVIVALPTNVVTGILITIYKTPWLFQTVPSGNPVGLVGRLLSNIWSTSIGVVEPICFKNIFNDLTN